MSEWCIGDPETIIPKTYRNAIGDHFPFKLFNSKSVALYYCDEALSLPLCLSKPADRKLGGISLWQRRKVETRGIYFNFQYLLNEMWFGYS